MESRGGGGSDPGAPHLPRRLTPRWSLPPRHTKYSEDIWRRYRSDLRPIQTGSTQDLSPG